MSIFDTLKKLPIKIYLRNTAICSGASFFIAYHVMQTCKAIRSIVNTNVIKRDTRQPEYIYVDDPMYKCATKVEQDELQQPVDTMRVWKSLKPSLAWSLLQLCRYGNNEQRNVAIERLAALKNNKAWDCCKIAQAVDVETAVLLARTRGADLRYFLPPPVYIRRQALSSKLLSYKFCDLITAVQNVNPHHCIQYFIQKYFSNVQEQLMESLEADSIPLKPDNMNDRDLCILCLEAIYHHLSLFVEPNYEEDKSLKILVNMGLLPLIAEAITRYPNDSEVDFAIVKLLTVLSVHTSLVKDFFQLGLVRELSRLLRSSEVHLSTSAAACLANLSGEHCYRPGLHLLHPIYRTTKPHSCDILLVHGLRGGVFLTWRQRDKKCTEPVGIMEVTANDNDCLENSCAVTEEKQKPAYLDPEFQTALDEYYEDEEVLADLEVILNDVPIRAMREAQLNKTYAAVQKRKALIEEQEDKCHYTFCWPKDWLPKDCENLRILGVNYWSSLSEWVEKCPLQRASIESRASNIVPALIDAGVGTKNASVVWLAHSMGGLIVKQALVDVAQSNKQIFKSLAERTKAVFFFSTPHRGSSLASIPRAAAAIIWPSYDVKQLQVDSPTLLQLNHSFIEFANIYDWETISFAESLPTLVTALKLPLHLVESYSADLGRGVFYQLALDHVSICKPATRQSILYTTVLDVVQRLCVEDENVKSQSRWSFINRLYILFKSILPERFV